MILAVQVHLPPDSGLTVRPVEQYTSPVVAECRDDATVESIFASALDDPFHRRILLNELGISLDTLRKAVVTKGILHEKLTLSPVVNPTFNLKSALLTMRNAFLVVQIAAKHHRTAPSSIPATEHTHTMETENGAHTYEVHTKVVKKSPDTTTTCHHLSKQSPPDSDASHTDRSLSHPAIGIILPASSPQIKQKTLSPTDSTSTDRQKFQHDFQLCKCDAIVDAFTATDIQLPHSSSHEEKHLSSPPTPQTPPSDIHPSSTDEKQPSPPPSISSEPHLPTTKSTLRSPVVPNPTPTQFPQSPPQQLPPALDHPKPLVPAKETKPPTSSNRQKREKRALRNTANGTLNPTNPADNRKKLASSATTKRSPAAPRKAPVPPAALSATPATTIPPPKKTSNPSKSNAPSPRIHPSNDPRPPPPPAPPSTTTITSYPPPSPSTRTTISPQQRPQPPYPAHGSPPQQLSTSPTIPALPKHRTQDAHTTSSTNVSTLKPSPGPFGSPRKTNQLNYDSAPWPVFGSPTLHPQVSQYSSQVASQPPPAQQTYGSQQPGNYISPSAVNGYGMPSQSHVFGGQVQPPYGNFPYASQGGGYGAQPPGNGFGMHN